MKTIVVGCGRVGAGLARQLATHGTEVTVVDPEVAALTRLAPSFPGERVTGSGLDRDVLVRAGIERAGALAAVTGSDEVNAVVALAARRLFRVPRVVARLYDPRRAAVHERLGIRTVAPVTWGIARIADLLTAQELATTATLGAGGVEVVDLQVPPLLAGRPAAELEVAGEASVVAVTRHGRTELASGVTVLEAGDLVHLAVVPASIGRLEALLGRA